MDYLPTGQRIFRHFHRNEITYEPPVYPFSADIAATLIQKIIRKILAKKKVYKEIFQTPFLTITNRLILKIKKIAYIGYELEGVSTFQYLRRLGEKSLQTCLFYSLNVPPPLPNSSLLYFLTMRRFSLSKLAFLSIYMLYSQGYAKLADMFERSAREKDKIRDRMRNKKLAANNQNFSTQSQPTVMQTLTVEKIANLPSYEFSDFGITELFDMQNLTKFQEWFHRTSPTDKMKDLSFINYYLSPYDTRSIRECIVDSFEFIVNKFVKCFPSNETRTRQACKKIVKSTVFPIAKRQLDAYIRKYATSPPELARVRTSSP
jgi:hypothetical protein